MHQKEYLTEKPWSLTNHGKSLIATQFTHHSVNSGGEFSQKNRKQFYGYHFLASNEIRQYKTPCVTVVLKERVAESFSNFFHCFRFHLGFLLRLFL